METLRNRIIDDLSFKYRVWNLPFEFFENLSIDDNFTYEQNIRIIDETIKKYIGHKCNHQTGYVYLSKCITEDLKQTKFSNDTYLIDYVYGYFMNFEIKFTISFLVHFIKNCSVVRKSLKNIFDENKDLFLSGKFSEVYSISLFKFTEAYYIFSLMENKDEEERVYQKKVYQHYPYPDRNTFDCLMEKIKMQDDEARKELVLAYMEVVTNIASIYENKGIEKDDLIQEAFFTFVKSIDILANLSYGNANRHISQLIHNALNRVVSNGVNAIFIGDYGKEQIALVNAIRKYYKIVYNENISNESLANILNISKKELESFYYSAGDVISLEDAENEFYEEELFVGKPGEDIFKLLYTSNLSPKTVDILERLYGVNCARKTQEELAIEYGVTRSAIGFQERTALKKMRRNSMVRNYINSVENSDHAIEIIDDAFKTNPNKTYFSNESSNGKACKSLSEEFKDYSKENLDYALFYANIFCKDALEQRYGNDYNARYLNERLNPVERRKLIIRVHNIIKRRLEKFKDFFNSPSVIIYKTEILNKIFEGLSPKEAVNAYIIICSMEKKDYPLSDVSKLLSIDLKKVTLLAEKYNMLYKKYESEEQSGDEDVAKNESIIKI